MYLTDFKAKTQLVAYHRNKFAVGGLTAVVLNCVTKIGIENIDVSSVLSHLDGVANGTLNS